MMGQEFAIAARNPIQFDRRGVIERPDAFQVGLGQIKGFDVHEQGGAPAKGGMTISGMTEVEGTAGSGKLKSGPHGQLEVAARSGPNAGPGPRYAGPDSWASRRNFRPPGRGEEMT